MTEDDDTGHPIGCSVYDITARSSAIVLEEILLTCGKWEKKMTSLTEVETEVYTESLRGSVDPVEPI